MSNRFRVEPLGPTHDRKTFSSDSPALDRYLHEQATQDVRRRVSNCFVAIDGGTVAGFYTFSAASFPLSELTVSEARKLPRYPLLPAGLIGRLAVDRRFRRQGLGGALIMDAVRRAAHSDPAIFAIIVDAQDLTAIAFYERFGFRAYVSRPQSLFLPISTALSALEKE